MYFPVQDRPPLIHIYNDGILDFEVSRYLSDETGINPQLYINIH